MFPFAPLPPRDARWVYDDPSGVPEPKAAPSTALRRRPAVLRAIAGRPAPAKPKAA